MQVPDLVTFELVYTDNESVEGWVPLPVPSMVEEVGKEEVEETNAGVSSMWGSLLRTIECLVLQVTAIQK